jgi:putative transposase
MGFEIRPRLRKAAGWHDIWHLGEVVISINGEKRYLWRAVDQEGYVLDEIVQVHRNTKSARRLLTRLLWKQGRPPKRIITVQPLVLAMLDLHRAESSHVPIRKRERMMQGFRSWPGLQRFVSTFSALRNHFIPPRSHRSALSIHLHRLRAMAEWKSVTVAAA